MKQTKLTTRWGGRGAALLIAAWCGLASAQPLAAQQSSAFDEFPDSLGFALGSVSGTGLSYRHWNDGLGYQLVAGGYYANYGWGNYWIGAQLMKTVMANDFGRNVATQLYGVGALGHSASLSATTNVEPYVPSFQAVAGIGIEILFFRHISTIFEVGYGLYATPFHSSYSVNVALAGSLQYRF